MNLKARSFSRQRGALPPVAQQLLCLRIAVPDKTVSDSLECGDKEMIADSWSKLEHLVLNLLGVEQFMRT